MGTSCFIFLLLLEMTALRLKGPSLALIDLGIYSEPLGSFYTPANSMATICPYHYPHHGPISESGSRIREGRENGKRWFGWCLWFPLLLPFPSLQPSFSESHAWLIMEQSCSPLICVCVTCPARSPPAVMVNNLRRSNWSTRPLCPLALPSQCQRRIHGLPRESKEKAKDFRWDLPSLSP